MVRGSRRGAATAGARPVDRPSAGLRAGRGPCRTAHPGSAATTGLVDETEDEYEYEYEYEDDRTSHLGQRAAPARGPVERVAFAWPNPGDSATTGSYGDLELVYTVAFTAADLFDADADHILTADLGEDDLEAA